MKGKKKKKKKKEMMMRGRKWSEKGTSSKSRKKWLTLSSNF